MTDDDPFFGSGDSDRTILKPMPGGRRPAGPGQPASPSPPQRPAPGRPPQGASSQPPYQPGSGTSSYGQPPSGYDPQPYSQAPAAQSAVIGQLSGGVNPITGSATTLIALMAQLRDCAHHSDPASLFQHVTSEIREFEASARAKGESPDHVLAARYVLCTALDETVLNTPWGSQSVWAQQTLLSAFHNETWGGEKFFLLLDRMLQSPAANLHLLELMYLLIALGFQGRYRVQERGLADLERVHENLYQVIRAQRGEMERSLSVHWRGVQDKRTRLARYVPLWVVAAVGAGVLLMAYLTFRSLLYSASADVVDSMIALGDGVPELQRGRVVQTAAVAPVDIRPFLTDEIARGLVVVSDVGGGQKITLPGEGLFASGRADVLADRVPLIQAIGEALQEVPGSVRVTGHTDDVGMGFGARYGDNTELSQARADAVRTLLTRHIDPSRVSAEGLADRVWIGPNRTPDERPANRRVEIFIQAQARRI